MLRAVRLVDQWRELERGLPGDWGDARFLLTLDDEPAAGRAAAMLTPLQAGRSGREVRFFAARRGVGARPDTVRRTLARLDGARVYGKLELLATGEPVIEPAPETVRSSLAASWQAQVAALPADWSDVYAEVEFRSTDHLERAAVLLSPLNPARFGGVPGFRFRSARRRGFGASPEMVHRCLERLDGDGIVGRVTILRALSESDPVATQGPVWYVGGRSV
jgi:hypothetical protein